MSEQIDDMRQLAALFERALDYATGKVAFGYAENGGDDKCRIAFTWRDQHIEGVFRLCASGWRADSNGEPISGLIAAWKWIAATLAEKLNNAE